MRKEEENIISDMVVVVMGRRLIFMGCRRRDGIWKKE